MKNYLRGRFFHTWGQTTPEVDFSTPGDKLPQRSLVFTAPSVRTGTSRISACIQHIFLPAAALWQPVLNHRTVCQFGEDLHNRHQCFWGCYVYYTGLNRVIHYFVPGKDCLLQNECSVCQGLSTVSVQCSFFLMFSSLKGMSA